MDPLLHPVPTRTLAKSPWLLLGRAWGMSPSPLVVPALLPPRLARLPNNPHLYPSWSSREVPRDPSPTAKHLSPPALACPRLQRLVLVLWDHPGQLAAPGRPAWIAAARTNPRTRECARGGPRSPHSPCQRGSREGGRRQPRRIPESRDPRSLVPARPRPGRGCAGVLVRGDGGAHEAGDQQPEAGRIRPTRLSPCGRPVPLVTRGPGAGTGLVHGPPGPSRHGRAASIAPPP